MWALSPQPLKPEYEEVAKNAIIEHDWRAFQKKWFQAFVRGKHITWQQWVILLSLEAAVSGKAPKRISIRSGHGIGKDGSLAWIILWFLYCHIDAQIPCTAPTSDQLDDILWKEISKWHSKMPEGAADVFDVKSEYIRIKERPKTWFARARTAKKEQPEALAGVHGDYVLYVSDEASAVPDEIYNTAEGALTNKEAFFIMISNPTRLEGYFYNSHHEDKENWQCLTFNSEDSPIVDHDYIERIESMHGKDSDEYRVRVLGHFPQRDIEMDGWIPLLSKQEIDQAIEGAARIPHAGVSTMGVDVADEGKNESVITRRSMNLAEVLFASARVSPMELGGEVIVYGDDLGINFNNVGVDKIGVGSGLYHRLNEQKKNVQGINITNEATDKKLFYNQKSEGYWRMREWIKKGGKLKPSKDPWGRERWYQLLNIRYKTADSSGVIMIMPKDMMRRKGIESPDVAESLMLTFCILITNDKEITREDVWFARKMQKKQKRK